MSCGSRHRTPIVPTAEVHWSLTRSRVAESCSHTVNYQPFNPAVPVPYVIAIVQLEEQADLRIATNIVDCEPDSVHIGQQVDVRFERQEVDTGTLRLRSGAPVLGFVRRSRSRRRRSRLRR